MIAGYLAAARELEERLLGAEMSEREREEGRRYLAGLVRWELERALVSSDPGRPRFSLCMDDLTKWGLENPDNIYRSAAIDGEAEYVIRGDRGTCADLALEVLTGLAGDDGTTGQGISCVDADGLEVAEDGTYTIRVGGDAGHNHLASGSAAKEIFVRHTLADWDESAGAITIERISPEPHKAPATAALVELAAQRLTTAACFFEQFAAQWRETVPVNATTQPAGGKGGGFLPGQRNAVGQYEIPGGHALVVTLGAADCRYVSLAIGHHRWFVSYDYANHLCHLNGAQARVSSDGRRHLVLSATDPGVANWIDTLGHYRGFLFLRYQGVRGEDPPAPATQLVSLGDLADVLPPGEPTVDAQARAATVASRRAAVERRFRR